MGGSLLYEEFSANMNNYKNIKYFVETGTYKADTTIAMSSHYDHVYTTEIHEGLYETSKKRAEDAGITNITFLRGNSIELLYDIVPKVLAGAVFFIDAHISGGDSSWNGVQRVPIMEELDVILSHKIGPSIFIIDDLRLWKDGVWDWAHVTNIDIVKLFIERGFKVKSFYEKNDRFYVFT